MAVRTAMFLFEVVVENIKDVNLIESRGLVIKSDFANIFSLELRDPKHLHITMPEPLPLPPEPPGKKGKKKQKAKPKPKKGKKGKKGKNVEEPPPEPVIQSGQSVLFASSAEVLIQNMLSSPLELSLWSKEENLVFIGTTTIPWDPIFITYLTQIANCEVPPPVTLKDEYNIFEEGKGKLLAKISIQVKLSFLNDKLTTAFRTLSEDPTIRKFLYTGINSKTTSYMCTLKSTDEAFEENCKKIENQFIVDKPKPTKIAYADYKNAPGANLAFFNDGDYCCMGHADKPPESIYKSPETCPDIDHIIDYVRKIIVSCNDNLRMLTPRPTITPRIKATDIDRLCYCRETAWPKGAFAERFKNEAQTGPCPICIDSGKEPKGSRAATFDIANIRGPCGKPECKIARDIRAYIENLVDEDNEEFKIDDLIGPCGSKECTLAATIQDFLRHEGVFTHGATNEGTSTQCACIEKMKESLTKRESCETVCSKDCEHASSEASVCVGKGCPFRKQKVYDVFYFTVQYDLENKPDGSPTPSGTGSGFKTPESKASGSRNPDSKSSTSKTSEAKPKIKICHPECPSGQSPETMPCSRRVCNVDLDQEVDSESLKCIVPVCPKFRPDYPPSPADSDIELRLDEIHNLCCAKSCDTAEKVKDFIAEGVIKKQKCQDEDKEDCFCDCVCTFKFSNKTTYCPVCGGYECLGDDMRYQPPHIKPHPCPVYHKLYDKKYIQVKNPWNDDRSKESVSTRTSRSSSKAGDRARIAKGVADIKGLSEKKVPDEKRRRSLDKNEGEKPAQEGDEEEKIKKKQSAKKGEGDQKKRKESKMEKVGKP